MSTSGICSESMTSGLARKIRQEAEPLITKRGSSLEISGWDLDITAFPWRSHPQQDAMGYDTVLDGFKFLSDRRPVPRSSARRTICIPLVQDFHRKSRLFNRFVWEPMNYEGFRKLSYNAADQKNAELMAPVYAECPEGYPGRCNACMAGTGSDPCRI